MITFLRDCSAGVGLFLAFLVLLGALVAVPLGRLMRSLDDYDDGACE